MLARRRKYILVLGVFVVASLYTQSILATTSLPTAVWPIVSANRLAEGDFTIDRELLGRLRPGETFAVALTETRIIELVARSLERRSSDRFVLLGDVTSSDGGSFSFVVHDHAVTGIIRSTLGPSYRIRSPDPSRAEIWEIAVDDKTDCETTEPVLSSPLSSSTGPAQSVAADDGSVIDVLVVYTPAARQGEGGVAAIGALIDLGVSDMNQALANSGVPMRIRLVHTEEVDYLETLDSNSDLTALRQGTGGLDRALELREEFCADIVTLVLNQAETCGRGYIMNASYLPPSPNSFSELAFNVVDRGCFSDVLTFPHELGHNMGARHDRENACSAGACTLVCCAGDASREQSRGNYDFSYGYRNPDSWRTVMGVSSGCACPVCCPRIPYYSTPTGLFEGDELGIAGGHAEGGADNATGFALAAPVVANWRASTICIPEPESLAMHVASLLTVACVSRWRRRRVQSTNSIRN